MIKYQNATRALNESLFVEVGDLNGSTLVVKSKNSTFSPAAGIKAEMVSGSVRVVSPKDVTQGDLVASVDESVEIRFNIRKGATADLTTLHTEVARVLGIASSTYNLALGLVPPSEATFTAV